MTTHAGHTAAIPASKVIGTAVYNTAGENIGTISSAVGYIMRNSANGLFVRVTTKWYEYTDDPWGTTIVRGKGSTAANVYLGVARHGASNRAQAFEVAAGKATRNRMVSAIGTAASAAQSR